MRTKWLSVALLLRLLMGDLTRGLCYRRKKVRENSPFYVAFFILILPLRSIAAAAASFSLFCSWCSIPFHGVFSVSGVRWHLIPSNGGLLCSPLDCGTFRCSLGYCRVMRIWGSAFWSPRKWKKRCIGEECWTKQFDSLLQFVLP